MLCFSAMVHKLAPAKNFLAGDPPETRKSQGIGARIGHEVGDTNELHRGEFDQKNVIELKTI